MPFIKCQNFAKTHLLINNRTYLPTEVYNLLITKIHILLDNFMIELTYFG